jgi:hypothetical protein
MFINSHRSTLCDPQYGTTLVPQSDQASHLSPLKLQTAGPLKNSGVRSLIRVNRVSDSLTRSIRLVERMWKCTEKAENYSLNTWQIPKLSLCYFITRSTQAVAPSSSTLLYHWTRPTCQISRPSWKVCPLISGPASWQSNLLDNGVGTYMR